MSGERFLLDSVIVIDHLNGVEAATAFLREAIDVSHVSAITRAEVLTGLDGDDVALGRQADRPLAIAHVHALGGALAVPGPAQSGHYSSFAGPGRFPVPQHTAGSSSTAGGSCDERASLKQPPNCVPERFARYLALTVPGLSASSVLV